jgi:hypothetical protein
LCCRIKEALGKGVELMVDQDLDEYKLQYLKLNGYIEFDKEKIRKELESKNIYSCQYIQDWINKYKYYRLMSDGTKMFYSFEYIKNHTVKEIEIAFQKIS